MRKDIKKSNKHSNVLIRKAFKSHVLDKGKIINIQNQRQHARRLWQYKFTAVAVCLFLYPVREYIDEQIIKIFFLMFIIENLSKSYNSYLVQNGLKLKIWSKNINDYVSKCIEIHPKSNGVGKYLT